MLFANQVQRGTQQIPTRSLNRWPDCHPRPTEDSVNVRYGLEPPGRDRQESASGSLS